MNRIFPRNLTARAAYDVPGNPPATRPESGVANCYPGLEFDHRNLDRRFFPGLVVEYVSQEDATSPSAARQGARVVAVDTDDVALSAPPAEYAHLTNALETALNRPVGALLKDGSPAVFVLTVEQRGRTITMVDSSGMPLDGLVVWLLVRSLRPGPVTLTVGPREPAEGAHAPAAPVTLEGWRRRYTDPESGVIDLSFQPGELSQSLCSPWMHDFRDCACTYWASNHPDIVFAEAPAGSDTLPGGQPTDPLVALTRVDWLRDRRSWPETAASAASQQLNRPYEVSHYEINAVWHDLAIVLEGREIGGVYFPRLASADRACPFPDVDSLLAELRRLAGLEHAVMLMYLYALFTVVDDADVAALRSKPPTLAEDAAYARHVLLDVATGEMQHLRWANHILWSVAEATGKPYEPAVAPPLLVLPGTTPPMPVTLAPLVPATLATFVEVERSSAYIDGQYSRVTATLRQPGYPPALHQLASNVAQDGENHFLAFRDLQRILSLYGTATPYLRDVTPGDPTSPPVNAALTTYRQILADLAHGYHFEVKRDQAALAAARTAMFELHDAAQSLARQGVGVPFLSVWQPA
jgi:hypothetical protein